MAIPIHRFGCSTAMFGGEIADKLDAMRAAGFAYTELMTRDVYETMAGPEHVLELLKASALKVSAYQHIRNFEGAPRDQMKRKIKLARIMLEQLELVGTDILILPSNVEDHASRDLTVLADDLRRLGDLAGEYGARIGYEPLGWGSVISDYRDAWRLVESTDHPRIGLMLDSSHIGSLGLSFSDIRLIDPKKIYLAEVADLPATRLSNAEQSRFYRLLPGDGMLPLEEFVQALESIGFDGVYSVELLNAHFRMMNPAVAAKRAFESMSGLWQRAMGS